MARTKQTNKQRNNKKNKRKAWAAKKRQLQKRRKESQSKTNKQNQNVKLNVQQPVQASCQTSINASTTPAKDHTTPRLNTAVDESVSRSNYSETAIEEVTNFRLVNEVLAFSQQETPAKTTIVESSQQRVSTLSQQTVGVASQKQAFEPEPVVNNEHIIDKPSILHSLENHAAVADITGQVHANLVWNFIPNEGMTTATLSCKEGNDEISRDSQSNSVTNENINADTNKRPCEVTATQIEKSLFTKLRTDLLKAKAEVNAFHSFEFTSMLC